MRILFINGDVPWPVRSGCARVTGNVLGILSVNNEVHLLCLRGNQGGRDNSASRLASYEVLTPEPENKRIVQVLSLLGRKAMVQSFFDFTGALISVRQRMERVQPDIVLFNHIRSAWMIPLLRKDILVPLVYLAHNAEAETNYHLSSTQRNLLKRAVLRLDAEKLASLERRILSSADTSITLTEEDEYRLSALQPDSHLCVIPPSMEFPSHSIALSGKITRLLLVGSFYWEPKRSNIHWLIKGVLPILSSKIPEIRLLIVGAGARLLFGGRRMDSRIEVFSDVSSTAPFFREPSIFVVPERQIGGIKIKTIEAAGYGLPVVSTSAGIEGTNLLNGTSCLVADTTEDFASSILRLIEDEQYRILVAKNAFEHVRKYFDSHSVLKKYESLLATLISRTATNITG